MLTYFNFSPRRLVVLFSIWAIFFSAALIASETTMRKFDSDKIRELREDNDYDNLNDQTAGFWNELRAKIIDIVYSIAEFLSKSTFLQVVGYLIMGVALFFIITRIMGINPGFLFKRVKSKAIINYQSDHPDDQNALLNADYEKALAGALAKGDLRMATRYSYLIALNTLCKADIITYRKDKTDSEYLAEIGAKPAYSPFSRIASVFSYVWYGNADASSGFQLAQEAVHNLKISLEK